MELISTVASCFTPTTLFLLLNLMIGTIVITSRFGSGSGKHHPHHDGNGSGHAPSPLTRAPSLIDRVKSINFHLYKFPHPETELFSATTQHDVIGSDLHVYPDPNPNPLQRVPSLLDRVKSFNMSYFKFPHDVTGSDPQDHSHPDPNSNLAPLQRAPSLLDRVRSINMSHFRLQQYNPEKNDSVDHTEPTRFENIPTRMGRVDPIDTSKFNIPEEDKPTRTGFDDTINRPSLTRTPSILERVKSIKLPSFYRSDPEPHSDQNPDPNSIVHEDHHKHVRSKSESKKPVKKKKKKAAGKMTKSASEKSGFGFHEQAETMDSVERRRPDTTRVEGSTSFGDGEDGGVDAKASDFINKFKQQLKLQRLDSILRNKEMLKGN